MNHRRRRCNPENRRGRAVALDGRPPPAVLPRPEGETMPRRAVFVAALALLAGCVERRFVIESDPPGALVLLNGQPLGTTPVDGYFTYYGNYRFTIIKDGFETLHV